MLKITPIPALADNYIWLLQQDNEAVCIDPGEAAPVIGYLKAHGLVLHQIWITHHHADHTAGLPELIRQFPDCRVYANHDIPHATHTVGEGSRWPLWQSQVEVWHTPGHTQTHLSYLLQAGGQARLFCGDTLFSAGCGRVFDGTPAQLFASLQRINRLPENTLLYPAHERQINPFLRTADFQVASRTAELSSQSLHSEEQVFAALRELKNHF